MTTEQIAREAEALPESEKARLVDLLLEQIHGPVDPTIERAQIEFARERLVAFQRGEDTIIEADEMLANLRKKYLQ